MRLQRILVIRQLHVVERADLDDSGVIDHDVDAAITLNRRRDRALGVGTLADVSRHDQHVGVRLALVDVVDRASQFMLVSSHQRQAGTHARELPREHQSKTTGSAGDDDRLAVEVVWNLPS